ncbi:MAG: DUF2726 domain-containing protein [Mariprofundaceae bacterium]|nr:DUF2726 domain-containing protein [Mariprofundaceae bacterium]
MDPVTAIFILLLFFGLMRRRREKKTLVEQTIMPTGVFPYQKRTTLLTANEYALYQLLRLVLGEKFQIQLKVAMAQVLMVNKNISASARPAYLKKINVKSADFVLCDPADLRIVAVIVLAGQQTFVDDACKAAALPLFHLKPNYKYNHEEIRSILQPII